MTIAEQIYALVQSLPEDQANEVLSFTEFIHAKYLKTNQAVSSVDPIPWSELINSLAGAWREDFPTLKDIRAEPETYIPPESF